MRALRITAGLALVLVMTFLMARPSLSSKGVLSHGFFSQPGETAAQAREVDALAQQPTVSIYPGQWAVVTNVGNLRTRHVIEFKGNGRFAADYTVMRDDRVVVDETHAGTYAVHGRTVTFDIQAASGQRTAHRARIASADGVHLVLLTPNDGPLSLTRIFDAQAALNYAP